MSIKIPDAKNPYAGATPFDVLGVSPSDPINKIKKTREKLLKKIKREFGSDIETYQAKKKELDDAWDMLRTAKDRFCVEIFFFDARIGEEECRKQAQRHKDFDFDYDRILHQSGDIFRSRPYLGSTSTSESPLTLGVSLEVRHRAPDDANDLEARSKLFVAFEQ